MSTSNVSRTFKFNTALYAIVNGTDLSEAALNDFVRPIRNRLMIFDGFTGCHISRYQMTVHYMPDVISEEEVIATVNEVVAWAAAQHDEGLNDRYFSLRRKTPRATPDWTTPEPTAKDTAWVKVSLNGNIVPLPVAQSREERMSILVTQCKELLEKLVAHNAVILFNIGLQRVELCYKTDQATEDEIRQHIKDVLMAAVSEKNRKFFTLLGNRPLRLTFV